MTGTDKVFGQQTDPADSKGQWASRCPVRGLLLHDTVLSWKAVCGLQSMAGLQPFCCSEEYDRLSALVSADGGADKQLEWEQEKDGACWKSQGLSNPLYESTSKSPWKNGTKT